MKPEDMRDDIPEDVREALAELCKTYGGNPLREVVDKIEAMIRAKPKTVVIPRAEIPAPLTEVPADGDVWSICPWGLLGVIDWDAGCEMAHHAVTRGLAWDTEDKALAALAAFTAREKPTRPGDDWTPHTPGDPMPCDGEALVEVQLRDGGTLPEEAAALEWERIRIDEGAEIIAWRYAREGEE